MAEKSLPKKPNVICLMAGTNDMYRGDPTGATGRLGELLDKLVTAVPESVVLVATLTAIPFAQAAANTFNSEMSNLVKARTEQGKKIAVVNMAAVQASDLKDGIHPNDVGYGKMADAWFKGFESVAAKGWIKDPVDAPVRFVR